MPANTKIFNESDIDLSALIDIANEFLPHAQSVMGFSEPVSISLISDQENSLNPLGKTAYYDPAEMGISLFVDNRHPKDILRSLSHELVHHTQNCNGMFDDIGEVNDGYAQEDAHMREMEREAYEVGNMCFRDWEDEYKKKQQWQLNEGALEDLFKSLRTKRGALKNPAKGFAQAATPGAGLTDKTFGLGQGGKEQPHFTEEDPGDYWDERPVPQEGMDVDIPGIGDSEEDKIDSSRAAKKERASTVKGWLDWIFLHQGEKDRKKAFYSALYEDSLDTRLKMSVYKEYSRLINKHGYGEKEAEQLGLDIPAYAGSDSEAGQGDLFAGPTPVRGGEEHRAGPERYTAAGDVEVPSADSDADGIPDSVEDGPAEGSFASVEDWANEAAENFQSAVSTGDENFLAAWQSWKMNEINSEERAAFEEAIAMKGLDRYFTILPDDPEMNAEPASALEAPGAQTREYETPEYAESEFAQAQRKAQLAQQGQVGKQASQINNKMINNAASRAVRSLGLPKNVINKGNLHKIVKSMAKGDANLDYRQFERALIAGDSGVSAQAGMFGVPQESSYGAAFKGVPEEQQRALAQTIANELQSIGGVNFQFYDTPDEPAMAAEGVAYEEETLDDLGDIVQPRRPPRRPKSAVEPLEPANESLSFDEELKIRAAVHSAMEIIQERVIVQQKQEYESNNLTLDEITSFTKLAGIDTPIQKNRIYQKGLIAEGAWTDRFLDLTGLDQAHKWGSKDWDEEGGGVVGAAARATGLAKAGNVLGLGLAAEDLDDDEIGGSFTTDHNAPHYAAMGAVEYNPPQNALDAVMTDDYEARAQERAEQVEMAFEEGYAQMADSAIRSSSGDINAMRSSPTDQRTILRLGVRLTGDDGNPIEAEHGSPEYKSALKDRAVYNDQNEFMGYNIKHHEIAQAAERKRADGERFRLRRSGADWAEPDRIGPDGKVIPGKVHTGTGMAQPPGDYLYDELARYEQAGYGSVGEGFWTFMKDVGGTTVGGLLGAEAVAGPWMLGGAALGGLAASAGGGAQAGGEYVLDVLEVFGKGLYYAAHGEEGEEAMAQRLRDEGASSWSDWAFGRFGNTVRKGNRFRDEAGSNMLGFGGDPVYGSVDEPGLGVEKFKPDSIDAAAELESGGALYSTDPETGERVEIDRLTTEEWEAAERDWIGDDPMNIAIAKGEYINPENWPERIREIHDEGFCSNPGASVFRATGQYGKEGTGASVTPAPMQGGGFTPYVGIGQGIYSSIKPISDSGPTCGFRNVAQMHIQQTSALNFVESAGGVTGGTQSHRERFIEESFFSEQLQKEMSDLDSSRAVYADLLNKYDIQTFDDEDASNLFGAIDLDLQNIGANLYQNQPEKVQAIERLQASLARMDTDEANIIGWNLDAEDNATLKMVLENYVSTETGRAKMEQIIGLEEGELRQPAFGASTEYALTNQDLREELWTLVTVPYVDLVEKQQDIAKYVRHEVARTQDSEILFGVSKEQLSNMSNAEILANERLIGAFANNERTKRPFRTILASRVLTEKENPQMLVSKNREEMEEVELLLQVNSMQNIYSEKVRQRLKKLPNEDSAESKHEACVLVSTELGASRSSIGCRQTTTTRGGERLWEPIPKDSLITNNEIRMFEENSFQDRYFKWLRQENFGNRAEYESMLISAPEDALSGLMLGYDPQIQGSWFIRTGPGEPGWEQQRYKVAAFGYAKLHQTTQDQEASERWLTALQNTENADLLRAFTAGAGSEEGKTPLENIGQKSMFEIVLTLADPPINISESDMEKERERTGMSESQIILSRQGQFRSDAIRALHAAGMLSDQQLNDATKRLSIVAPLRNTVTAPGFTPGRAETINPGSRSTLTGKTDFLNWFQETYGTQYADADGNITAGAGNDPSATASFTKSLTLIERTGTIADMHRFMQVAPGESGPGGETGVPVGLTRGIGRYLPGRKPGAMAGRRAEISNSVFMQMWYEQHGADDNSREWILRYAPDILFKHLYAQDRRAQMLPGGAGAIDPETGLILRQNPNDPNSPPLPAGPGYQLLQNIRDVVRTKRGRGQATPGQRTQQKTAQNNNQNLPGSSNLASLPPPDRIRAANLHTKQKIENGDYSRSYFKVPWGTGVVDFGNYNPRTNKIALFPPNSIRNRLRRQYGTDNNIDYTDEQTLKVLADTAKAIQRDLGLSDPPAIYSGREQIWPPPSPLRENIKHSLRHLPNDKLIKEQIIKTFADKNINISRKRLEEVVRKHILQELNNNA